MNILSKTQLDNYIDDDFSKELKNLCKISKESLDEKKNHFLLVKNLITIWVIIFLVKN